MNSECKLFHVPRWMIVPASLSDGGTNLVVTDRCRMKGHSFSWCPTAPATSSEQQVLHTDDDDTQEGFVCVHDLINRDQRDLFRHVE